MVGDVNVFFSLNSDGTLIDYNCGEIEVMIAEESARRKGIAQEALTMMLKYVSESLGTTIFEAKILKHNTASLSLFKDKLGFEFHKENSVFDEIVLRKVLNLNERFCLNE